MKVIVIKIGGSGEGSEQVLSENLFVGKSASLKVATQVKESLHA